MTRLISGGTLSTSNDIIFNFLLISLSKVRLWEPAIETSIVGASDCCTLHIVDNTEKHINKYKIERCSLWEGREAWEDEGSEIERGSRDGRRLVTGVRSGWGRASCSMRTKYHICQQFLISSRGTLSTSNDIVFNFLIISLSKGRTLEPASAVRQIVDNTERRIIIKSRRYSLREGREVWEDGGSEIERGRQGGPVTCDRGQVGWGRASRSMRTKYHINQQFVEFGRVSVIPDALFGETSKVARLLVDSKTIPVWWNI